MAFLLRLDEQARRKVPRVPSVSENLAVTSSILETAKYDGAWSLFRTIAATHMEQMRAAGSLEM